MMNIWKDSYYHQSYAAFSVYREEMDRGGETFIPNKNKLSIAAKQLTNMERARQKKLTVGKMVNKKGLCSHHNYTIW